VEGEVEGEGDEDCGDGDEAEGYVVGVDGELDGEVDWEEEEEGCYYVGEEVEEFWFGAVCSMVEDCVCEGGGG